jgi:uncharacterized membrane protein YdbT with pleckstrin-like domain/CRP-like cAMP-binding protein
VSLSEKAKFLGTLEIFADLTEEELAGLATIADEYEFEKGSMVAYQRDTADKLIIVRNGRLFACRRDKNGIARDSRSYFSGDYFDDVWLFSSQAHPQSVQGADSGRFIFIEQEKFQDFLNNNSGLIDYLNLSDKAFEAAEGSQYGQSGSRFKSLKLLSDEIVRYQKRRSVAVLLFNAGLPLVIGLILIGLIGFFLGLESTASLVIVFLILLLSILIAGWRILDWTNDYFVITNRYLIHREFSLKRFQANINKTPIDMVQSVEVLKPSLFSTLLNIGTAHVTTAAQSASLTFDRIDNPREVQDILIELQEEARSLDSGRVQEDIRAAFDTHFEVDPGYIMIEEPPEDDEAGATMGSIASGIFRSITRGVGTKVVSLDGTITYRKHPVTMLGRTFWPMLAGLALIVLIWMFDGPIKVFFAGLLFLDFLWYIWSFEDWRNETFQVTDRQIVDIDRKPFFFGVSRKQADIANVQNVSSEKPSFLATVFNFGNVKIETAGASADIVFESVGRPNRVQRDIFRRREDLKKKQSVSQREQRREEYAVVADVFQQSQELDHIPRRI